MVTGAKMTPPPQKCVLLIETLQKFVMSSNIQNDIEYVSGLCLPSVSVQHIQNDFVTSYTVSDYIMNYYEYVNYTITWKHDAACVLFSEAEYIVWLAVNLLKLIAFTNSYIQTFG